MFVNQLNIQTFDIERKFTESTGQMTGELNLFLSLKIQSNQNIKSSQPNVKSYDFALSTENVLVPYVMDFNFRSVTIPTNLTPSSPLVIPNFFTNIRAEFDSTFTVIPRDDTDGFVTYDLFFTYLNPGLGVNESLTVISSPFPPGVFSPPRPSTVNVPFRSQTVLRNVNGVRVYDYFILD